MANQNQWQILREEIRRQYELFDSLTLRCIEEYSNSGKRIHCGKGCCECCNLAVNSTYSEALCVAEILTEAQTALIKAHADKLLKHIAEVSDLKSYLGMQRKIIGFCPLLTDNRACGVYGQRPFSCRSLLSTLDNAWCATDFALLSPAEKTAFMESLDRQAVAFPMHYLAASRDLGQQFESRSELALAATFGFTLSGNLPFLIYLEKEYGLGSIMCHGYSVTMDFLRQAGLFNPFLVTVEKI